MATVLIVIHLMVVLAMIAVVLLQRSEGGALGIGGGGGGGGLMTARGAGNLLTRTTAILALVFFLTSVGLTILARIESRPSDILDQVPGQTFEEAPASAPADGTAPVVPPVAGGGTADEVPGGPGILEALRPDAGSGDTGPQAPPSE